MPPHVVVANIIVGIGFLGTGAVIKQNDSDQGLTTAASVWAVAAIAIAVALNLYFLAVVAELLVLFTLFVLRRFESKSGSSDAELAVIMGQANVAFSVDGASAMMYNCRYDGIGKITDTCRDGAGVQCKGRESTTASFMLP